MIEYHLHHVEPVLKYLLISVGSSLMLVISLLVCAKKAKSNMESSQPYATYVSTEMNYVAVPVHEEPVECVQEATVEWEPKETEVTMKPGSSPTTAILPNTKEPLRKVLSSIDTNVEHIKILATVDTYPEDKKIEEKESSASSQCSNPYDMVTSKKNVQPIFECSGNSDSGNSIYAKVKDFPAREESAYAVVEINDTHYDFVDGNVVRRKVEIVAEKDESFPDFCLYDKPNCVGNVELVQEAETSGASTVYECVTDRNKPNTVEPSSFTSTIDCDLYDSCGPAPVVDHPVDICRGSVVHRLKSTMTSHNVLYRSSSKEMVEESNKCENEEEEKQSRLSRYLKFTQSSKKSKKIEDADIVVDMPTHHIPSRDNPTNNVDIDGHKAPPLPSVDKLKHISAHRKGQHSISDKNYSPEASLGGSSPTESPRSLTNTVSSPLLFVYNERKSSIDADLSYTRQELPISYHRPRTSEGNINTHALPGETLIKTQPQVNSDKIVNNFGASEIGIVLEKSISMENPFFMRDSITSEPDYAEIETRHTSDNSNSPVVVNDDKLQVTTGHTKIDYGNGPLEIVEGGSSDVTKGYAVIDYSKKNEDRRIRDLYATVDYSSKKPHVETTDNPSSIPVRYEGPYDVIPDVISVAAPHDEIYEELTARNN